MNEQERATLKHLREMNKQRKHTQAVFESTILLLGVIGAVLILLLIGGDYV